MHVWGAVHYDGQTDLVTLQGNATADAHRGLLETEMQPYARRNFSRNFVSQHNNAPARQARYLQKFLQDEAVEQLPWTPNSPDLNPIEHAWDAFGECISLERCPAKKHA